MHSLSDAGLQLLNSSLQWVGIGSLALALLSAVGLYFASAEAARRQDNELRKRDTKIEALERASRPKPLRDRLLSLFDDIDPEIRAKLKSGIPVTVSGFMKQSQKEALNKMLLEPECAKYITPIPHGESHGMGDAGPTAYAHFTINPALSDGR